MRAVSLFPTSDEDSSTPDSSRKNRNLRYSMFPTSDEDSSTPDASGPFHPGRIYLLFPTSDEDSSTPD